MKALLADEASYIPGSDIPFIHRAIMDRCDKLDGLNDGIIADPLVKGRPVDFIDAEKMYVELCALAVMVATIYRVRHRRSQL